MAPPVPVVAVQAEECEPMPALCGDHDDRLGDHDDRLGDLEKGQATHTAQLQAGTQMFQSIQDSIRMLSTHVSDSMTRVENTVNRVAVDVSDLRKEVSNIRVEQAKHASAIATITAQKVDATEQANERRKTIREYAVKLLWPAVFLSAAALAGRYGPGWLSDIFRGIAGG